MNNLTTRKIVLGMLMALVLAFSVLGTPADAVTLTHVSDRVQSNIENSTFEITFSVGLKSDTTAIKNDQGKLIDDGTVGSTVAFAATAAVRIDSKGYLVTVINGKDYRLTTISADANDLGAASTTPDRLRR